MKSIKTITAAIGLSFCVCISIVAQNNTVIQARVGVGIKTPEAALDINSPLGLDALLIENERSSSLPVALILAVPEDKGVFIGSDPGDFPIDGLYIEGNMGLGTGNAPSKLSINGAIRFLGGGGENPAPGTIRWNTVSSDLEGYNGNDWLSLTPEKKTYQIGQYEDGGVVFWVSQDGTEVKLVYIGELTEDIWCSPFDFNINGAESTDDGLQNSLDIVNAPGMLFSAAEICLSLTGGGKSDWYMPSIGELELMYAVIEKINPILLSFNGDSVWADASAEQAVWSSTEVKGLDNTVLFLHYGNRVLSQSKAIDRHQLRAIRTIIIN